ncbi:unnamed protein product [Caenorhabditis auriculariae]|uniref:Uncharacterized protein n=1 Tax=Caenorhabditis auriculariae TaxID=2777116 RepID=A0A8S1HIH8_9PELO|nr:unnamed protein product [Caenorhabditis auriculariae]
MDHSKASMFPCSSVPVTFREPENLPKRPGDILYKASEQTSSALSRYEHLGRAAAFRSGRASGPWEERPK